MRCLNLAAALLLISSPAFADRKAADACAAGLPEKRFRHDRQMPSPGGERQSRPRRPRPSV